MTPDQVPLVSEIDYWDGFYSAPHRDIASATSFAVHVERQLRPGSLLFELGCGNGRDVVYFARRGHRVAACDLSHVAIERLGAQLDAMPGLPARPELQVADFAALDDRYADALDVVYARFTLHAVPPEVGAAMLDWASRNLRPGGLLFIEARSVLGELYGKGVPAGEDAFIHDGHYRRFIRRDRLVAELRERSLEIDHLEEAAGLAVHLDDDPVVIRVRARRPGGPGDNGVPDLASAHQTTRG